MSEDEELAWLEGEINFYEKLPPERMSYKAKQYLAMLKIRQRQILLKGKNPLDPELIVGRMNEEQIEDLIAAARAELATNAAPDGSGGSAPPAAPEPAPPKPRPPRM